jgi:hypothetical protein
MFKFKDGYMKKESRVDANEEDAEGEMGYYVRSTSIYHRMRTYRSGWKASVPEHRNIT